MLLLLGGVAAWFFLGGYYRQIRALKEDALRIAKSSSEEDFMSEQTSEIYAADGTLISRLKGEKDSCYLTSEEIPEDVKTAIVSIEDKKFYEHDGVDKKAILRAFLAMIRNGEPTQGGSTITQQLARNIYLTMDKTWQRKMEEIFLSQELEKKYSKDQILEFYLNNIYFANGYYGIEAASQGYFSKSAKKLSLSEIAFLLAIPNNPSYYDPLTGKEHTLERRDRILDNMLEDGVIGTVSYQMALNEEILLHQTAPSKNVYVETFAWNCATKALMERKGFLFRYDHTMNVETKAEYDQAYGDMYAVCQRDLYTGGYRVYTTLDLAQQSLLQASIDEGTAEFSEMNEEGVYALQASGVCIDNDTGMVTAIVGGRSQSLPGYTLNRAYQSFRQPGSAIKPLIVYTPALERGYEADTHVMDVKSEDGPSNSGDGYSGEILLRDAVAYSKNTVADQIFQEITPETGLDYLDEMQFTHIVEADVRPASALGGLTKGCSALEMTSGFACIENDGIFRDPTCVARIEDGDGNVLYESDREGKNVYRENAARKMTDILTSVMDYGTGRNLNLGEMPSAGKTGTTNDSKDGWFVGYTGYYTAGIWVGYDMPRTMDGLQGATYPGRIWQDFMLKLHEGLQPREFLPYSDYTHMEETENDPLYTEPSEEEIRARASEAIERVENGMANRALREMETTEPVTETEETATETGEPAPEGQEMPAEGQEVPVEGQEVPVETPPA